MPGVQGEGNARTMPAASPAIKSRGLQATPIKIALILQRLSEQTEIPVDMLAAEVLKRATKKQRRNDRSKRRIELSDWAWSMLGKLVAKRNGGMEIIGEIVDLHEYTHELETLCGLEASDVIACSRESEAVVFQSLLHGARRVRLVLREAIEPGDFADQLAGDLWAWCRQASGVELLGGKPTADGFPAGKLIQDALERLMIDVEPLPEFRWPDHAEKLRRLRISRKCAAIAFLLRQQIVSADLFAATMASGLADLRRLVPLSARQLWEQSQ